MADYSKRTLNRIVDIYPDGVVIANGNPNGVYMSRNFGKTWNRVINRGCIDNVRRLSDNTFIYSLKGLSVSNVELPPEGVVSDNAHWSKLCGFGNYWQENMEEYVKTRLQTDLLPAIANSGLDIPEYISREFNLSYGSGTLGSFIMKSVPPYDQTSFFDRGTIVRQYYQYGQSNESDYRAWIYYRCRGSSRAERMLTTDMFRSNHRHSNLFWDDALIADSATNPDLFYVGKVEGGQCVIYIMKRSDYIEDITVKCVDQYELNINSLKYLNVIRKDDVDIVVVTDNSGTTAKIDISNESTVEQIEVGSSIVATDGQKLILDLASNPRLEYSLALHDTTKLIIDYFPKGSPIQKVRRAGYNLYVFYDDRNYTVLKYNTEIKRASLFFQLRENRKFSDYPEFKPGIPQMAIPQSHNQCDCES